MCPRCFKAVFHAKEGGKKKVGSYSNTRLWAVVDGKVRLFDEVMGEAIKGSCELVSGGTHSQQSPK